MTFDYRAQWSPTSRRGVVGLCLGGVVLLVTCALWLTLPMLSDSNRSTTAGTVVDYRVDGAPGIAAQFRPTIAYSVGGRDFTLTASQTVTAPDRRQLPVGAETVVRYDPTDPASAEWQPGGSIVAVNVPAVTGLIAGFTSLAYGVVLWRRSPPTPLSARSRSALTW